MPTQVPDEAEAEAQAESDREDVDPEAVNDSTEISPDIVVPEAGNL